MSSSVDLEDQKKEALRRRRMERIQRRIDSNFEVPASSTFQTTPTQQKTIETKYSQQYLPENSYPFFNESTIGQNVESTSAINASTTITLPDSLNEKVNNSFHSSKTARNSTSSTATVASEPFHQSNSLEVEFNDQNQNHFDEGPSIFTSYFMKLYRFLQRIRALCFIFLAIILTIPKDHLKMYEQQRYVLFKEVSFNFSWLILYNTPMMGFFTLEIFFMFFDMVHWAITFVFEFGFITVFVILFQVFVIIIGVLRDFSLFFIVHIMFCSLMPFLSPIYLMKIIGKSSLASATNNNAEKNIK